MKFINCADYEEMSEMACKAVFANILQFQNQLLCAATGNSVKGLYTMLAAEYKAAPQTFENLRILKLDEWVGIAGDHPASCESYLREYLTGPLGIPRKRYIGFKNMAEDTLKECERVEKAIDARGGIGCCILGLGVNGHIGFNEPGEYWYPKCHMTLLSETSIGHNMIASLGVKPKFGLTLGMRAIMQARKVVLLISGSGKRPIVENLLRQKITPNLPASFLWAHPDVCCFRDLDSTS